MTDDVHLARLATYVELAGAKLVSPEIIYNCPRSARERRLLVERV